MSRYRHYIFNYRPFPKTNCFPTYTCLRRVMVKAGNQDEATFCASASVLPLSAWVSVCILYFVFCIFVFCILYFCIFVFLYFCIFVFCILYFVFKSFRFVVPAFVVLFHFTEVHLTTILPLLKYCHLRINNLNVQMVNGHYKNKNKNKTKTTT